MIAASLRGPCPQTVVTRAAHAALSPVQLDWVLVHERAHLRARHHRTCWSPMPSSAREQVGTWAAIAGVVTLPLMVAVVPALAVALHRGGLA